MGNILKLQVGYSFWGWYGDKARRTRFHIGLLTPRNWTLCNIEAPLQLAERELLEEDICKRCLKIYRKRIGG